MEIQHACIGPPLLDRPAHAVVIQRARPAEPPGQALLRADIVSWEDMQTTKASQQHVLGRPSPDAAQLTKVCCRLLVALMCQTFDVHFASVDPASEGQQGMDLLAAEPNRVVVGRRDC